jgi:hypothetical protein
VGVRRLVCFTPPQFRFLFSSCFSTAICACGLVVLPLPLFPCSLFLRSWHVCPLGMLFFGLPCRPRTILIDRVDSLPSYDPSRFRSLSRIHNVLLEVFAVGCLIRPQLKTILPLSLFRWFLDGKCDCLRTMPPAGLFWVFMWGLTASKKHDTN